MSLRRLLTSFVLTRSFLNLSASSELYLHSESWDDAVKVSDGKAPSNVCRNGVDLLMKGAIKARLDFYLLYIINFTKGSVKDSLKGIFMLEIKRRDKYQPVKGNRGGRETLEYRSATVLERKLLIRPLVEFGKEVSLLISPQRWQDLRVSSLLPYYVFLCVYFSKLANTLPSDSILRRPS